MAAALAAGWAMEAQFVAPGAAAVDGPGEVHELAPNVIERVASTESPQPVVAVFATRASTLESLRGATFVIVADRLADPGNVGTVLRSAEAAGADAVVLTSGSVDVYNPKTVRASAGAIFHVPVVADVTIDAVALAAPDLELVGTSSHQGDAYDSLDLTGAVAIVLGNEAHGLDAGAPVHRWVRIPHRGRAESLNVAMAATVLAFEIARQRRAK